MKILAQRCGAYFRVQRLHSVRDLAHGGPGHVEAAHLRQRPGVRILTRETIPVVVRHVRTNRKGYGVPVGREHHFSSASGTFAVKNIHKEVDTVKTGILDKYSFAVSPIIRRTHTPSTDCRTSTARWKSSRPYRPHRATETRCSSGTLQSWPEGTPFARDVRWMMGKEERTDGWEDEGCEDEEKMPYHLKLIYIPYLRYICTRVQVIDVYVPEANHCNRRNYRCML